MVRLLSLCKYHQSLFIFSKVIPYEFFSQHSKIMINLLHVTFYLCFRFMYSVYKCIHYRNFTTNSCYIYLILGCMLCLGRSNYFRFNHPQEAKKIKEALPNCRISCAPIDFLQGLFYND